MTARLYKIEAELLASDADVRELEAAARRAGRADAR